MKYFAVLLPIVDQEKNKEHRPGHLDYINEISEQGKIHSFGRFMDGVGGLVIFKGERFEEIEALVLQDPCIVHGARTYEIHEWEMKNGN